MRTKHQAAFALGFFGLFCLATACGDDSGGSSSGNEAGESGAGADSGGGGTGSGGKSSAGNGGKPSAGNGGKPSAGNGGTMSSNGGEPMGDAGKSSGDGGQTSGDGGKPSTDGGQPSGGNAAGNGGEPSGLGGAAGAGGASDGEPVVCTPITLGQFGQAQVEYESGAYHYALYATSFTPNIGSAAADSFHVSISGPPGDYDGDMTGTFDLTQNGDDNYLTCSRCLLVEADGNQKTFYQSEGTLTIAPGSKQLGGTIDATITNLKLVEVTIDGNAVSTPVPNGACLTVASATVQVEAPPCDGFECNNGYCVANADFECDMDARDCPDKSDEYPINTSCDPWVCPASFYDDGECDCGCGSQDVDCNGTTNENECEFCSECQGNTNTCGDNQVDPANTTQCL